MDSTAILFSDSGLVRVRGKGNFLEKWYFEHFE